MHCMAAVVLCNILHHHMTSCLMAILYKYEKKVLRVMCDDVQGVQRI